VSPLDEPPSRPDRRTDAEVHHALCCLRRADEFDVVSSHLGVLAAAVANGAAPPFLHTISDPIATRRSISSAERSRPSTRSTSRKRSAS
jgi:hypothetical protein